MFTFTFLLYLRWYCQLFCYLGILKISFSTACTFTHINTTWHLLPIPATFAPGPHWCQLCWRFLTLFLTYASSLYLLPGLLQWLSFNVDFLCCILTVFNDPNRVYLLVFSQCPSHCKADTGLGQTKQTLLSFFLTSFCNLKSTFPPEFGFRARLPGFKSLLHYLYLAS
jgi:hypothetical protein